MSLQGGNLNQVASVKRQRAGNQRNKKSHWYARQSGKTWQSQGHCESWNVINQNPIDQVLWWIDSRFYWHRNRHGMGDHWKQWIWQIGKWTYYFY